MLHPRSRMQPNAHALVHSVHRTGGTLNSKEGGPYGTGAPRGHLWRHTKAGLRTVLMAGLHACLAPVWVTGGGLAGGCVYGGWMQFCG